MNTEEIEDYLILTVKANLENPINQSKIFCSLAPNENEVNPLYFLNLFYTNLYLIQQDFNSFLDSMMKEIRNENPGFTFSQKEINFYKYLTKVDLLSMSRILNINKLSKEYAHSVEMGKIVQKMIDQKFDYLIRSRGDGDSFYRSVMYNYIILVIKNNTLENFIQSLSTCVNAEDSYRLRKCAPEVRLVIKILKSCLNIGIKEEFNLNLNLKYLAFYFFLNIYQSLDLALIRILRELIYKFAKTNMDFSINDMKLNEIISAFDNSYKNFLLQNIRNLGKHPIEPIFLVTALMMEINIKLYRIDTQNTNSFYDSHYKDKSDIFQRHSFKECNLDNETIYILYKDGNYNSLLKEEVVTKEMKKFGSKNLKPFEILFETKIQLRNNQPVSMNNESKFLPLECKCKIPINQSDSYYEELFQLNLIHLIESGLEKGYICPNCKLFISIELTNKLFEEKNIMKKLLEQCEQNFCIFCKNKIFKEEKLQSCKYHWRHTKCGNLKDPKFLSSVICKACLLRIDYSGEESKSQEFDIEEDDIDTRINMIRKRNYIVSASKNGNFKMNLPECCNCKSQEVYIELNCGHYNCANCGMVSAPDKTPYEFINKCYVCEDNQEVRKIICGKQCCITDPLNYRKQLHESIKLSDDGNLLYYCPKCLRNINLYEYKFIFGQETFFKVQNALSKIEPNLNDLFDLGQKCFKCQKVQKTIKIYNCPCSFNFCFSCLKEFNFSLHNIPSSCHKCESISHSKEFILLFEHLHSSSMLDLGFSKFKNEILEAHQILQQDLKNNQNENSIVEHNPENINQKDINEEKKADSTSQILPIEVINGNTFTIEDKKEVGIANYKPIEIQLKKEKEPENVTINQNEEFKKHTISDDINNANYGEIEEANDKMNLRENTEQIEKYPQIKSKQINKGINEEKKSQIYQDINTEENILAILGKSDVPLINFENPFNGNLVKDKKSSPSGDSLINKNPNPESIYLTNEDPLDDKRKEEKSIQRKNSITPPKNVSKDWCSCSFWKIIWFEIKSFFKSKCY